MLAWYKLMHSRPNRPKWAPPAHRSRWSSNRNLTTEPLGSALREFPALAIKRRAGSPLIYRPYHGSVPHAQRLGDPGQTHPGPSHVDRLLPIEDHFWPAQLLAVLLCVMHASAD